jgi:hypothetical protein
LLLYLWWECFQLWDRSFAYRTIEAVADAVRDIVAGDAARSAGRDWRQDTWRAVGNALRVMYLDGLIFKQMNLSCADKVESEADKAITELGDISGDLHGALRQLADQPGGVSSRSSSTISAGLLSGIMWSVSISRYRQAGFDFAYSAARQNALAPVPAAARGSRRALT